MSRLATSALPSSSVLKGGGPCGMASASHFPQWPEGGQRQMQRECLSS